MFNIERLERGFIEKEDYFIIIDTCKTPDAGWETAMATVTKKEFAEIMWEGEYDFTLEDFKNWWSEISPEWTILKNYRSRKQAEKNHEILIKTS